VGLLAQMGAALFHHNDPAGYAELVAEHPTFLDRRYAEGQRYGINSLRLTAVALEQWGFPPSMTIPLNHVDDLGSPEGALLRASFEVTSRLTIEDYEPKLIGRLTGGRLAESDLPGVLEQVRADADDLRRAMLGE
jgi:hypothetical protein